MRSVGPIDSQQMETPIANISSKDDPPSVADWQSSLRHVLEEDAEKHSSERRLKSLEARQDYQ